MTGELDSLLSEARKGGAFDSAGSFSVDFHNAQRKFREYLLADANRYILRLVRSAVLSGAGKFEARLGRFSNQLHFPSLPFPPARLPNLFDFILGERDAAWELAVAVNALVTLDFDLIEVLCQDRESGYLLRVGKETSECIETRRADRPEGVHFYLRRRRRLGTLVKSPPEIYLLREFCRFCPIPLQLNGRLLQKPWGRPRGPHFLRPAGSSEVVIRSPNWYLPGKNFWVDHHILEYRIPSPVPESSVGLTPSRASTTFYPVAPSETVKLEKCRLALAVSCDFRAPHLIDIIHAGQRIHRVETRFEFHGGVHVLVNSDGLVLDATGELPVENEALQLSLEEIHASASALVDYLKGVYPKPEDRYLEKLLFDKRMRGRWGLPERHDK